jgi:hypothetical protein
VSRSGEVTPLRGHRRFVARAGRQCANQPHFDALEVKGGGDATSAARAVL